MRLASYRLGGRATWGVVENDRLFHCGNAPGSPFPDLKSLIARDGYGEAERLMAEAEQGSLADVEFLPVIPNPGKILCVGLNYDLHRQETGRAAVEHPTLFTRFADTLTGQNTELIVPRVSERLDFEGELAVVIGKAGRHIAREDAAAHVAGFCCLNDGSVRDWQAHTPQFTPGKNFPGTGGCGPWMSTPDELGDLSPLRIETRLNGQVMQQAHLGDMIFPVPVLIEYCSTFTRLEPGDLLVTGTPAGVGAKRNPPLWLRPGDTVEVEIERLGTLRNGVAAEQ